MTPEQIKLIRGSFELIAPISDAVAKLFYARLFDLDPSLELLFKGDMAGQRRKLMASLALCVKSLDRPEEILPAVGALGVRHEGYGVKERDYKTVGAALLWTLERGLGPAFTPAVKEAWAALYETLAVAMRGRHVVSPEAECVFIH